MRRRAEDAGTATRADAVELLLREHLTRMAMESRLAEMRGTAAEDEGIAGEMVEEVPEESPGP